MVEPLIQLNGIQKSFFGIRALDDINMTINVGEVWCLVGENGSGKSTIIKIIAGVYEASGGEIILNGKKYKHLCPIDSIKEGIQIIYQDFSLFPNMSVAENIAINYQLSKNKHFVNWNEIYLIAKNAMNKINIYIDLNAKVENLSVAEKQLVAISRALLQNAKLIIMDEPTTALTQNEIQALFKIIDKLRNEGISILFVSHKLDEVLKISQKIIVVRNGKKIISGDVCKFDKGKLVYYMTGREITPQPYLYKNKQSVSMLKVKDFTSKGHFRDVSFELYSGEIMGITGLLGSGRNELAKALFGINPADSGEIFVNGKPSKIRSVKDALKYNIGYVPEDRLTEGLFLDQSIGRNIVISSINKLTNKVKLLKANLIDEEIKIWVKKLNIAVTSANLSVRSLSGGNQQRVVIARWLATEPKILILNCPTVGVDIGSKEEIHVMIKKLAQQGIAIIMISDDIPELLQTCNRIFVMKKGIFTEEFENSKITEEELSQKLIKI